MTLDELRMYAMALPSEDRETLGVELLNSLNNQEDQSDVNAVWAADIPLRLTTALVRRHRSRRCSLGSSRRSPDPTQPALLRHRNRGTRCLRCWANEELRRH